MNAPTAIDAVRGPLDLTQLASPSRLLRPAWLYAVVIDQTGHAGPRRFLASLPQGSAVFTLAAPGVSFLLAEQSSATSLPLAAAAPLDAAAIDAWYGALLSCPGFAHSDSQAVPLGPGERRHFVAGRRVTARQIVWLQGDAPILRYPAAARAGPSPAASLLVMADQIAAELIGDGALQAIDTATLAARDGPTALGTLSAQHAARIAAALIERDADDRQRWRQTGEIDETRAARALQHLRDIAVFHRRPVAPSDGLNHDPLAGALAIIGAIEGFAVRTPANDDVGAALFERLKSFTNAGGLRFREIALDGDW